jgi:Flp pilus assembly pilin Flp
MTKNVCLSLRSFLVEEDAPTLAEYGILVSLIAVIGAVGVSYFGTEVSNLFGVISDAMP